jgi:TPP-dependent pyruvate/acetoin dehydrogenase alpha subunit
VDKKIGEELQEAIEYAETSPAPHPDEALKYGYAPMGGEM